MANTLKADVIDFGSYMNMTDAEHKVRRASVFVDDVVNYFHSPGGPIGHVMPWPKTHGDIRFRPGEITLWSGFSGSGKSAVLGQVALGFGRQHARVCIASMEMRPEITLARMCRAASATNKPDQEFIRQFHRVTDGWLYLYDQQGTVKPNKMLAVIRYCADRLKIQHFILDSLMKCGIPEDGNGALSAQKSYVDSLCALARDTGLHIHLVAHSRKKTNESDIPGKFDVKGSGSITDQVDNVITVWRNKPKEREMSNGDYDKQKEADVLLICDKQRNGEWEGVAGLWFDRKSTQFLEGGMDVPKVLIQPAINEANQNEGK